MFFWRWENFAAGLPPLPFAPEKALVCCVTGRESLRAADPAESVLANIRVAIEAGADWVQIREKDLNARELLALARSAVAMAKDDRRAPKARVLINDRLDVALAAGAAGVHLGRESAPAREVVRWCRSGNAPAEFLIGASCHNIEEAREAEGAGASYVFFGPVYDTPSKRSFGPPQGLAKLSEACRAVRLPVIAIGGVNEGNAEECLRAGAAGIAAIRLFQEARDPAALQHAIARLHNLAR
ncbi:MAG: thiamine phosphate synthase [Candidatus Acidiferrales bacterium]